jgi:hypothetical protein
MLLRLLTLLCHRRRHPATPAVTDDSPGDAALGYPTTPLTTYT